MISFPDPLHPAVVHFPIALILVGAAVAVVSVFLRRWHMPLLAAIVLSLGALGTVVATFTGEKEEEKVEHAIPSVEPVLEEHAEWGERARNAGIAAAVLAVIAVTVAGKPIGGRLFSVLTACAALVAGYCVAQAGHFGGELVYRHGAGVIKPARNFSNAGFGTCEWLFEIRPQRLQASRSCGVSSTHTRRFRR